MARKWQENGCDVQTRKTDEWDHEKSRNAEAEISSLSNKCPSSVFHTHLAMHLNTHHHTSLHHASIGEASSKKVGVNKILRGCPNLFLKSGSSEQFFFLTSGSEFVFSWRSVRGQGGHGPPVPSWRFSTAHKTAEAVRKWAFHSNRCTVLTSLANVYDCTYYSVIVIKIYCFLQILTSLDHC